jgi:hypothetical protein
MAGPEEGGIHGDPSGAGGGADQLRRDGAGDRGEGSGLDDRQAGGSRDVLAAGDVGGDRGHGGRSFSIGRAVPDCSPPTRTDAARIDALTEKNRFLRDLSISTVDLRIEGDEPARGQPAMQGVVEMFYAEITRSIVEARRQDFEREAIQHNLVKAIRRGQVAIGGRERRRMGRAFFALRPACFAP